MILNEKATMVIPAEYAKFDTDCTMGVDFATQNLQFAFRTDMEVLKKALPPIFEPVAPVISGGIVYNIKNGFTDFYREASMGTMVKYKDTYAFYLLMFVLSGPGAENATIGGRERFGLPKKLCENTEDIAIEKDGNHVHAYAKRKGVTLMDVTMELDETLIDEKSPKPGDKSGGLSYYLQPIITPAGDGADHFARVDMYSNVAENTMHKFVPAASTIVKCESSIDDPWGEFPVLESLNGAYTEHHTLMKELYLVESFSAEELMPYLMTTRYDKIAFIKH